jgi:hypothetical protein
MPRNGFHRNETVRRVFLVPSSRASFAPEAAARQRWESLAPRASSPPCEASTIIALRRPPATALYPRDLAAPHLRLASRRPAGRSRARSRRGAEVQQSGEGCVPRSAPSVEGGGSEGEVAATTV